MCDYFEICLDGIIYGLGLFHDALGLIVDHPVLDIILIVLMMWQQWQESVLFLV